ncbi:MAG: glycoside hydrolase family 19 protein [Myxococcales bacterium]|nr:glycoside hydrolase family 19 protein [Myxococcales bacterium]
MVVQAFRDELGREPSEEELQELGPSAEARARVGDTPRQISSWLEDQLAARADQQAGEITDGAFQEVLERTPEAWGYWHDQAAVLLGEGSAPEDVAGYLRDSLRQSDEYRSLAADRIVDEGFRSVLGRTVEAGAPGYWQDEVVSALERGATEEEARAQIEAGLRQSEEYRRRYLGVSVEQLRGVMPNLGRDRAEAMLPLLNSAMEEAEINTPMRRAAFLAQLAHESGELRWFEELDSGRQYEGRRDLGNVEPGDGPRYKGRGPIQITGRSNYRNAGRALGLDLEGNPSLAAEPEVGFRTAAWYWNSRGINAPADGGDFDRTTYLVNGGTNGAAERRAYYRRALAVL